MLMTRDGHGLLNALEDYSHDLLVVATFYISLCFVLRRSKLYIGTDSPGDPGFELTAVVAVEKVFLHSLPSSGELDVA